MTAEEANEEAAALREEAEKSKATVAELRPFKAKFQAMGPSIRNA